MNKDEARRIAANMVKLPWLLTLISKFFSISSDSVRSAFTSDISRRSHVAMRLFTFVLISRRITSSSHMNAS